MNPYGVIDLHCDTLTKYDENNKYNSLNTGNMFSVDCLPKNINWAQFFAVFIEDTCKTPMEFFLDHTDSFYRQIYDHNLAFCKNYDDLLVAWGNNKRGCFLTVENGNVLEGNLDNIKTLKEKGVSVLTLVWNGENELGSGNDTEKGLTSLGKEAISVLEDNNITIDISHLNDKGVYDFLKIAKKPFIASHSNSRTICNHKRNLPDEFIKEIIKRDGLIGINFHIPFVTDKENYSFNDLYKHIERIISLGGIDNLALGSDFDGGLMPDILNNICKANDLYTYLTGIKSAKEEAVKLFYKNALKFIKNNFK